MSTASMVSGSFTLRKTAAAISIAQSLQWMPPDASSQLLSYRRRPVSTAGWSRPEFILGPAKGRTRGPPTTWRVASVRLTSPQARICRTAGRVKASPASLAGRRIGAFVRHLGGDHDPSRMLLMRARAFSVAQRVKSASIDRRACTAPHLVSHGPSRKRGRSTIGLGAIRSGAPVDRRRFDPLCHREGAGPHQKHPRRIVVAA